jgi:hypothetical protein
VKAGRKETAIKTKTSVGVGEIGWSGMDCVVLAEDRNKWRALVTAAMKFWDS